MKDLPSKKHYCYKIHTSWTKSSVSPFYRQPSSTAFMDYPSFLQEIFVKNWEKMVILFF